MQVRIETVVVLLLCVVTCFACWQMYQIAQALRPVIDTIEAVKHFVPWQ